MSATPSPVPSWADMVRLQPRLADLAALASRSGGARDWVKIVRELRCLVGWAAGVDSLGSSAVYEEAYRHVRARFEQAGGQS